MSSLGLVIDVWFAVGCGVLGFLFFQVCGFGCGLFGWRCGFGVIGLWFGWFSGFGFWDFVVLVFDLLGLLFWVAVLWCCLAWFWVLVVVMFYDADLRFVLTCRLGVAAFRAWGCRSCGIVCLLFRG